MYRQVYQLYSQAYAMYMQCTNTYIQTKYMYFSPYNVQTVYIQAHTYFHVPEVNRSLEYSVPARREQSRNFYQANSEKVMHRVQAVQATLCSPETAQAILGRPGNLR